MKSVFAVLLGLALFAMPHSAITQESVSPPKPSCADLQRLGNEKIEELEGLPVGISVIHNPASVEAEHDPVGKWPYKWTYATSVSSLVGDIVIEEFGTLSWSGTTWSLSNFTGAPFTTSDFASWYSCPEGLLNSGAVVMDPENWSANLELKEHIALWYFIGVDGSGQRVKGQAIIHQVAKASEE